MSSLVGNVSRAWSRGEGGLEGESEVQRLQVVRSFSDIHSNVLEQKLEMYVNLTFTQIQISS